MGADLIGHMVRGPTQLDTSLFPAALDDLKRRQNAVNPHYLAFLSVQDREIDPSPDDLLTEDGLREALWQHFPNLNPDDQLDIEEGALLAIQQDGEALLRELEDVWCGYARDCAWRDFDDGTRVVFCGELTWGDTPTGTGFQTLDLLVRLGLSPLLGIT